MRLRDQLYEMAQLVVSLVPDYAEREAVEERAAIMEIDGGLTRETANLGAMIRHMKGRQ